LQGDGPWDVHKESTDSVVAEAPLESAVRQVGNAILLNLSSTCEQWMGTMGGPAESIMLDVSVATLPEPATGALFAVVCHRARGTVVPGTARGPAAWLAQSTRAVVGDTPVPRA
jgi:hypothetical protein